MEKEKVRHPCHIRCSWSVTGGPGNIVGWKLTFFRRLKSKLEFYTREYNFPYIREFA